MSWRDRVQPASWRGVVLEVEQLSTTVGRRTVTHEYPGADEPFVEDLGRATRLIELGGYVVGEDYDRARDALIAAVEQPGSGVLVHPYLGRLTATCTSCAIDESKDERGRATVRLAFVEAGARRFPTVVQDYQATISDHAETVRDDAAADFADRYSVDGPQWLAFAAITEHVTAVLQLLSSWRVRDNAWLFGGQFFARLGDSAALEESAQGLFDDALTLIEAPAELAARVQATLGLIDVWGLLRAIVDAYATALTVTSTSGTLEQSQANTRAQALLWRRTALAYLAELTPDVDVEAWEDAVELQDIVTALLDVELLETDLPLAAWGHLRDLRASLIAEIDERLETLPHRESYTPGATIPACVLAQRLYGDGSRGDEIATRNRVWNALFLRGGVELTVLSS